MNFKRKIISYLAFILTIVFFTIIIINYFSFYARVKDKLLELETLKTKAKVEQVEGKFKDSIKIGKLIKNNKNVQTLLRKKSTTLKEKYEKEFELNQLLSSFTDNNPNYRIYILSKDNEIYHSTFETPLKVSFANQKWFKNIINQDQNFRFFKPKQKLILTNTFKKTAIFLSSPIYDKFNGNKENILLIEYSKTNIKNILNDSYYDIIFHNSSIINNFDKNTSFILKKEINIDNNIYNNIYLINTNKISRIMYSSNNLLVISIIAFFVLFLIILFLSFYLLNKITEPINKVTQTLRNLERKKLVFLPQESDQISFISKGVDVLITELNTLVKEIKSERLKLKKVQIEMLQAFINPHFLYNTIENVVWLIYQKNNKEAIKLLNEFTDLLKIIVSKGESIITVEKEIEHIKCYLTIQKIRYPEIINYEITLDDDLKEFVIPKLSLQPLIENAIYHGIRDLEEGEGFIGIDISSQGDNIITTISDNGPGMPEKEITNLNNIINSFSKDLKKRVYGVKNVNERIKLFYGDEYGLTYKANKPSGIIATIIFPKRKNK